MKRILVVDDDTFLLQGLGKVLKTPVTAVKTVENGQAALEEISSSSYHLCFLDLFLPDLDGVEVLRRIKEISPQTKVIIMTAGVATPTMQARIERDADMFLTKPFDLLQIKMLSRSILEPSSA